MYYYEVLVSRKVPQITLTYFSKVIIPLNSVVEVSIRGKIVIGIVISEITKISFDIKKINEIGRVLPIRLTGKNLEFIKLFSYNTFNNLNNVIDTVLNPITKLSRKDLANLQDIITQTEAQKPLKTQLLKPNIKQSNFYVENDSWVRIKYIIRRCMEQAEKSANAKQILIVCPEKSVLENYFNLLQSEFQNQNIYKYIGDSLKASRITFTQVLNPANGFQIIISTRQGIFLPFTNLVSITLLDEGNPFYIQEQNSVYYDTRDAVFFLNQVFNAELNFITNTPSIRLYNMYSEAFSDNESSSIGLIKQKLPGIKLRHFNRKDSFFELFSEQILDDIGVESEN